MAHKGKPKPIIPKRFPASEQPKSSKKRKNTSTGDPTPAAKRRKQGPQRHAQQPQRPKAPRHDKGASGRSFGWSCTSVVDQQATYAVGRLLQADSSREHGASLKSLTLAPHIVAKKATYAVTCQVMKFASVLQQLDERVGLTQRHPQLSKAAAYVLMYEMLQGEGFQRRGPAEKAVAAAKAELKAALAALMQEQGAQSMEDLLPRAAAPDVPHPRWVRVNTLKCTLQQAMAALAADQQQQPSQPRDGPPNKAPKPQGAHPGAGPPSRSDHSPPSATVAAAAAGVVLRDTLLPDLLALPPGTDLHAHPLVAAGRCVLQSKASCMPAHALAPQPGWTVVDCCAAPGNKTTHLAALMGNQGRVLAYDKDPRRLARLRANAQLTGATCIEARLADFLSLDPTAHEFAQVRGVLLDPSCSGSGTTFTRMDHLMPSHAARSAAAAASSAGDERQRQPGGGASPALGAVPAEPAAASGQPTKKRKSKDKQQQSQQQQQQGAAATSEGASDLDAAAAAAGPGAGSSLAAPLSAPLPSPEQLQGVESLEPEEAARVGALARFQSAALAHALRFPALQRLVYSTCSVHVAENEAVVLGALPQARAAGFELRDPFPQWPRRGLPLFPGAEKLVRTDAYVDGTDGFFVAVFERARPADSTVAGAGTAAAAAADAAAVAHAPTAQHSKPTNKKHKKGRKPSP